MTHSDSDDYYIVIVHLTSHLLLLLLLLSIYNAVLISVVCIILILLTWNHSDGLYDAHTHSLIWCVELNSNWWIDFVFGTKSIHDAIRIGIFASWKRVKRGRRDALHTHTHTHTMSIHCHWIFLCALVASRRAPFYSNLNCYSVVVVVANRMVALVVGIVDTPCNQPTADNKRVCVCRRTVT